MDLDNEHLNPSDPLRSLFREAGRREAPQSLESQVMARISAPTAATGPISPLIEKRMWWVIAAIIAALVICSATLPSFTTAYSAIHRGSALVSAIQQATTLLSSPWSFAVLLGLGGLTAIDRWAERWFHPAVHH